MVKWASAPSSDPGLFSCSTDHTTLPPLCMNRVSSLSKSISLYTMPCHLTSERPGMLVEIQSPRHHSERMRYSGRPENLQMMLICSEVLVLLFLRNPEARDVVAALHASTNQLESSPRETKAKTSVDFCIACSKWRSPSLASTWCSAYFRAILLWDQVVFT